PVGRPHGAGPVHPRVHVGRDLATAILHLDHLQCAEHGAAVIPVSMRKNDSVHSAEIESQAFNVSLEYRGVGTGVEQERLGVVATPRSDGAGQAVCGAAQALARQDPTTSPPESSKLVLDELGGVRK